MTTTVAITAGMTGNYPTKDGGFRVRVTNAAPDPQRQSGLVLCDVLVSHDPLFTFGESILVPAAGIVPDEIGCAPKPYVKDANGVWNKREAACIADFASTPVAEGVHMQERAYGTYTYNDGQARRFDDNSTDPRTVIAQTLAKRSGWAEIRPGHWAEAGAVVKALKAAGQLVDRRRKS